MTGFRETPEEGEPYDVYCQNGNMPSSGILPFRKRQGGDRLAIIASMAKRGRPPSKKKTTPKVTKIGRLSRLHAYVDKWMDHLGVDDASLAGRLETSPSNITKWRDKEWKIGVPNVGGIAYALGIDPPWRIFSPPEEDPAEVVRQQIREEYQQRLQRALGGS